MCDNFIQVKYHFKEHPESTLSLYFKTEKQVTEFKNNHPDFVYLDERSSIQ
jgi:hypothetical protein